MLAPLLYAMPSWKRLDVLIGKEAGTFNQLNNIWNKTAKNATLFRSSEAALEFV